MGIRISPFLVIATAGAIFDLAMPAHSRAASAIYSNDENDHYFRYIMEEGGDTVKVFKCTVGLDNSCHYYTKTPLRILMEERRDSPPNIEVVPPGSPQALSPSSAGGQFSDSTHVVLITETGTATRNGIPIFKTGLCPKFTAAFCDRLGIIALSPENLRRLVRTARIPFTAPSHSAYVTLSSLISMNMDLAKELRTRAAAAQAAVTDARKKYPFSDPETAALLEHIEKISPQGGDKGADGAQSK